MKKSAIVIGFGAFFLTLALLLKFYAYPKLAVIPKDQNTSQTLTDEKARFLDVPTLKFQEGPIGTTATVVADQKASEKARKDTGNDDALVINQWQYTAKEGTDPNKEEPISATTQRYAIDRKTGKVLDWADNELDDKKANYQGSYTIKLPFGLEEGKSYPYWDTTLGKPVQLDFQGKEDVKGMETYKYEVKIPRTVFTKMEAPGSLFGLGESSAGQNADRSYENTITIWADPKTGVFMKMRQHQIQKLTIPNKPAVTVMDTTSEMTDETVQKNVDEYSSKGAQLNALGVAPWALMPLGIILLIIGGIMWVAGGRRQPKH